MSSSLNFVDLFIYRFVFQTSDQDIKKIREKENDELRGKVKTLEELAEVRACYL